MFFVLYFILDNMVILPFCKTDRALRHFLFIFHIGIILYFILEYGISYCLQMQWHVCCDNEVWGYSLVLLIHGFAQNGSTIWIIGKRKQAHSVGHTSRPIPLKEQHWDSCGGDGSAPRSAQKIQSFQSYGKLSKLSWISPPTSSIKLCQHIFTMLCFCFCSQVCGKISHVDTKLINFTRLTTFDDIAFSKRNTICFMCFPSRYIFQTNVLDQKFFSYHSFVSAGVWALLCHPDIGWQHDNLDSAW